LFVKYLLAEDHVEIIMIDRPDERTCLLLLLTPAFLSLLLPNNK
jgi:hypothetical protein